MPSKLFTDLRKVARLYAFAQGSPEAEKLRERILGKIRSGEISLSEVTPKVMHWLNISPAERAALEAKPAPGGYEEMKKMKETFPERFPDIDLAPEVPLEEKVRRLEQPTDDNKGGYEQMKKMKKMFPERFPDVKPVPKIPIEERVRLMEQSAEDEEVVEEITPDEVDIEEPVFEVAPDDLDEDVLEEVEEIGGLPSDEEIKSELEEEQAFEEEPGRLAGLADDAMLDDDKDEEDEEEESDEWDGQPGSILLWLGDKMGKIPPHRGSLFGCQRAHAFLDDLLKTLSAAVRKDKKGEIDEDSAEKMRVKLMRDMAALDGRVKMLGEKKVACDHSHSDCSSCDVCGSVLWKNADGKSECLECDGIERTPGIVTGDKKDGNKKNAGFIVTPFIDAIACILINSKVSAGRDMEETFKKLADKYDITDRERLEIVHVLEAKGYPVMPLDRGRLGEGAYPRNGEDTVEWIPNYFA
jgi:hypothetical protein